MVGCWNLELKMIPNDRARLGLGPRGGFGLKILIFGGHGGHGPPVHRGILAFFEGFRYKRLGPISRTVSDQTGTKSVVKSH